MKKILLYTSLFLFATGLSSCTKSLNQLPSQAKTEGNVIVDQKSAEIALNGAYSRLANVGVSASRTSTQFAYNHEVVPAMLAGWLTTSTGAVSSLNTHMVTPEASAILWTPNYALLNAANGVIEGTHGLGEDKFTQARKSQILAEARFLRAYAHFSLLSYYGQWHDLESPYGVMLRKAPLRLSNAAQPRSTVRDTYDFILEDIDYAIQYAPDNNPNHYANKAAAQALKMRVLISKGQQEDYLQVIRLADDLLSNNSYQLEANLKDLMKTKGLTSKEIIFGIKPFANQQDKINKYTTSSFYLANYNLRKLLENDPREDWMLEKAINAPVVRHRDSTYLSKFFGSRAEDAYVFRLTETYLLKAEALVRSGGGMEEAKNLLKTVMAKAGVSNFSAIDAATTRPELLLEIYYEFSRNMVAEDGIEWFALLRLPFETVSQIRPSILKKEQYILPVPLTEFELNPSFGEQNPGYYKQ